MFYGKTIKTRYGPVTQKRFFVVKLCPKNIKGGHAVVKFMEKEYKVRIYQVVRYIEENLASPLTVEELANVSAFSVHHFHRIFKRVMNENVLQFINRLRVELVVKMIHHKPERSLTQIALDCGLQSPAHLARTFRRYMGMSASEYKDSMDPTIERYDKARVAKATGSDLTREMEEKMEEKYRNLGITIRRLPERRAACIQRVGTLIRDVAELIVELEFDKLYTWMRAHEQIENDSQAVVSILDDPYITPESKQRYAVCFTTSKTVPSATEIQPFTLKGGMYAVVPLTGPIDELHPLIHMVSLHWLRLSPYQWDESRGMLAIFPDNSWENFQPVRMEFCIPIQLR
ncbi:AraC family transcriptional regulator [Paenibacillus sp. P25]|nr:AraC family transcriptional regulator [Paenibacillus sp. P25]